MTRDSHQIYYETVVCKGEKSCKWPPSAFERAKTSGRLGRRYGLRGLPPRAASCGDSRGSPMRDGRGMHRKPASVQERINRRLYLPATRSALELPTGSANGLWRRCTVIGRSARPRCSSCSPSPECLSRQRGSHHGTPLILAIICFFVMMTAQGLIEPNGGPSPPPPSPTTPAADPPSSVSFNGSRPASSPPLPASAASTPRSHGQPHDCRRGRLHDRTARHREARGNADPSGARCAGLS
jgi:hypothetical protein